MTCKYLSILIPDKHVIKGVCPVILTNELTDNILINMSSRNT